MLSKNEQHELDYGLKLMRKNLLSTDINETLIVDRYDQLSIDIVDAKSKNLIIGLPQQTFEDKHYDKERLKVICDRLHNLGYLNKDNIKLVLDKSVINSDLEMAIKNFQQDANLNIDGWIGEQTWLALQQLVTFEQPTKVELWLKDNGEVNNALKRAIQLRLYIFGLGDKPKFSSTPLDLELDKFRKVILTLFNEVDELNERKLLELLFDQDRILESLSKFSGDIDSEEFYLEQKFVIAVTKIELWLHGEESISPDPNLVEHHNKYSVGPRRSRRRRIKYQLDILEASSLKINPESFFYKALYATWYKLRGKRLPEVKHKCINYIDTFPAFFKLLNDLVDAGDKHLINSLDTYIKKNKKNIKAIWKSAKSLSGKLFDGLKRIGRMIKRFFVRVLDVTVKWLARPFYNLIVSVYQTLNTSIQLIIESISFLFSKYIKLKENNSAFALKKGDADMDLFVDEKNSVSVLAFSNKLLLSSKKLKVASKLVSTFITLLKITFLASTGGWWAFFTSCVGLYKKCPELIESITLLHNEDQTQPEY